MLFPTTPDAAHAEETTEVSPRATTSVSLNVPATIEFADVMATPDGATTTASAEIEVITTASAGYKLYVYAEDNALKSLNPQTQQTIAATTQTSVVEELTNNTWGYNLSEGTTAGTTFAALPTSDAAPVAEKNTSATGGATGDIYTLALGAKVDSTIPSGTYTSTLTISVVAEPALVTIVFNGNGATSGSMDSLRIPAGSSQTLPSNTFARTNYNYDGWNTSATGNGTSYADGSTYIVPADAAGTTITLYAQWADPYIMQDFTAADCQSKASRASVYVRDSRDQNIYTARYINGACWMTQNLRIASGTQLTSADSNLPDGTIYTIPTADLTLGNSYIAGRVHAGEPSNGESATDTGYWYNFCAASAGINCQASTAADTTADICPKGWSLPNKDQIDGLGGTAYLSAFAPVTGGRFYNGTLVDTNIEYWWSSTAYGSSSQYSLYYNGSSLYTGNGSKYNGFHVRCVRSS